MKKCLNYTCYIKIIPSLYLSYTLYNFKVVLALQRKLKVSVIKDNLSTTMSVGQQSHSIQRVPLGIDFLCGGLCVKV